MTNFVNFRKQSIHRGFLVQSTEPRVRKIILHKLIGFCVWKVQISAFLNIIKYLNRPTLYADEGIL